MKTPQRDAKVVKENLMRNKVFTQSQVFPHNILINSKGKKIVNCYNEENWQVIKANITSNGTNQHHVRTHHHYCISPAKNA